MGVTTLMTPDFDLAERIRALGTTSRTDLLQHWRRHLKSEPPRYASPRFLARAVAYALQERHYGGLPAATRRQLMSIAKGGRVRAVAAPAQIKPGTRLL